MATTLPCRLSVFLARREPIAVILRRGPSGWVQMIKWYTDRDIFEPGQWIRAKVYADDCDISPNGDYFLSCIRKIMPEHRQDPEIGVVWDAISRPPYFTALAVWGAGIVRNYGGIFVDDTTILRRLGPGVYPEFAYLTKGQLPASFKIMSTLMQQMVSPNLTTKFLHGWQYLQPTDVKYEMSEDERILSNYVKEVRARGLEPIFNDMRKLIAGTPSSMARRAVRSTRLLIKQARNMPIVLNLEILNESYHWKYKYSVRGLAFDQPLVEATWADWDHKDRLVYASKGKIFSASVSSDGIRSVTELADFNANKPEQIEAPDWAKAWP